MLDFRLESFLSVCDTMNYRKSAQMLHITQPAITQHIHFLEGKFGCKLFVYENRLLKKTHQGRILEQHARTMLAQEERLLRQLGDSRIQSLSIGATKTIGERGHRGVCGAVPPPPGARAVPDGGQHPEPAGADGPERPGLCPD